MKFTKENVCKAVDKWFEENTHLSVEGLIESIDSLDDTPEKVVVPKFVAEWIEFNRSKGVQLSHLLACYREIRDNPSNHLGKTDDAGDWFVKNPYKFVRAFVDGYEVEKEPLYCVKINRQYLVKTSADCNHHSFEESGLWAWDESKYQFTEQEIKEIDERYWPFAVPVND